MEILSETAVSKTEALGEDQFGIDQIHLHVISSS
jgi:hypothetical protein